MSLFGSFKYTKLSKTELASTISAVNKYIDTHFINPQQGTTASDKFSLRDKSDNNSPHISYSERDAYDSQKIDKLIRSGFLKDQNINASFICEMNRLMIGKGLSSTDVYKAAGIDRRLFSKISSDSSYKPSKETCIAICIALRLNAEQTNEMLERVGYTLSHSIKRDVAIEYCLRNGIWPVANVNEILYALGLSTL